jgi:hypothetical protein
MKKVISFLIFAIACALLISCRSTHKCVDATNTEKNPNLTEVTLHQTEVA